MLGRERIPHYNYKLMDNRDDKNSLVITNINMQKSYTALG